MILAASLKYLITENEKSITFARLNLSVAQLVEQLTLNQWVTGSNPVGETKKNHLKEIPTDGFIVLLLFLLRFC